VFCVVVGCLSVRIWELEVRRRQLFFLFLYRVDSVLRFVSDSRRVFRRFFEMMDSRGLFRLGDKYDELWSDPGRVGEFETWVGVLLDNVDLYDLGVLFSFLYESTPPSLRGVVVSEFLSSFKLDGDVQDFVKTRLNGDETVRRFWVEVVPRIVLLRDVDLNVDRDVNEYVNRILQHYIEDNEKQNKNRRLVLGTNNM